MARTHYPINNGYQPPPANTLTVNRARQQMRNAAFSGPSGAQGLGDRGAGQYVPGYTSNPYDSNDFVFRWRQYVHLYEISWEARKIIRIPVEDALRKDWILTDIPEESQKKISARLDQLQVLSTLKRSLMLERLLGGCLTFMGLDAEEDDPSQVYKPTSGETLRFCNAIPISRIARITWDTNPLSEHYMRPSQYLINGQNVHVSRCLVWDGEPLFDPYDFALTNFRSNLAGFGPSKLAPIWDDIMKAVGTRQAAYQLIQTNNAILAAVSDLQDLSGTSSGQKALQKVQQIANQLSVYRAALIDGDKVDIKQQAASFGSVPELLITYLQVLAAASDIPATRFLGQAPGGLNATGDSDLENYYNTIDAFQQQRVVPQLRRIIDVVAYDVVGKGWKKERDNLTIKFPPMWNDSELEQAQTATARLDNLIKLSDSGKISDDKFIEEINALDILTVKLDETDISLLDDMGEEPANPQEQLERLKGMGKEPGKSGTSATFGGGSGPIPTPPDKGVQDQQKQQTEIPTGGKVIPFSKVENTAGPFEEGLQAGQRSLHSSSCPYMLYSAQGKDWMRGWMKGLLTSNQLTNSIDPTEFALGMEDETEHLHVIDKDSIPDLEQLSQIVLDHLKEYPDYYSKLRKAGLMNAKNTKPQPVPHSIKRHGLPIRIETASGMERTGTDRNGHQWNAILAADYGFVEKVMGADGDEIDVFVGSSPESELVVAIDQVWPDGTFDEHKFIICVDSIVEAKAIYQSSYTDGASGSRIGHLSVMTIDQFKDWLKGDSTLAPIGFMNRGEFKEDQHPRAEDGKFGKGGAASSGQAAKQDGSSATLKDAGKDTSSPEPLPNSKTDKESRAIAEKRGYKVPPGWSDVWVNPNPNGSPQVRAKDAKGRTVSIRTADANAKADAEKFARLKAFTAALPGIKRHLERDMIGDKPKPEAQVLYLISKTGFRVGGEKDTGAEKQAYGASTLTSDHISIEGDTVSFNFTGKKGVDQAHDVKDPKLASILQGREGKLFDTDNNKVLKYLKKISGSDEFKTKDFRTYVGTATALKTIKGMEPPTDMKDYAKKVMEVAKVVAAKLGNTPTMAKKAYIDPTVFKAWEEGYQNANKAA